MKCPRNIFSKKNWVVFTRTNSWFKPTVSHISSPAICSIYNLLMCSKIQMKISIQHFDFFSSVKYLLMPITKATSASVNAKLYFKLHIDKSIESAQPFFKTPTEITGEDLLEPATQRRNTFLVGGQFSHSRETFNRVAFFSNSSTISRTPETPNIGKISSSQQKIEQSEQHASARETIECHPVTPRSHKVRAAWPIRQCTFPKLW